jgi:hypothetical protein
MGITRRKAGVLATALWVGGRRGALALQAESLAAVLAISSWFLRRPCSIPTVEQA